MKTKLVILTSILILSTSAFADNREHKNFDDRNEAIHNEREAGKYNPSNTGVNIRDRNDNRLTADDQGTSKKDTDLVARVRSSLMKDDSLSTIAQNVKLIALNGVITLRGPVKSVEERKNIETKAVQIAGLNNVRNELEVDSKN